MRYMMFIKHTEDYRNATVPQELMDAMGGFITESMQSGKLLDTAGLKPTGDGFRVRVSGRKLNVTDGPFTESKEIIGGYALMNLDSRDEAVALATKFMDLHREHWPEFVGECEVRPLQEMEAPQ